MGTSVEVYPRAAVERAMKVQEVILRAMARKLTWFQAAEIMVHSVLPITRFAAEPASSQSDRMDNLL